MSRHQPLKGGTVRTSISCAACVVAFGLAFIDSPAAAPAQEGTLPVPLRLSAFAVNMSTVKPGATAVMDIRITRWSMAAEREKLLATAVEKGQDALLRALQKMPDHGRMRIPGWTGPDPHNARLGWTLRYAWMT